jgi:hypothetical protein
MLLAEQILENLQEPCGLSQMASALDFHGSAATGQRLECKWHLKLNVARLDPACRSVDHGVRRFMTFSTKFLVGLCIAACLVFSQGVDAQNSPAPASKPQTPPPASEVQTRITIEVTGGEKSVPVENASVYVKFIEEHAIKKDKKLEMNVKTSRDGIAHVPNAPMGRVWVQVVAEGWHTYGRWLDITDPKQTIKVHLEKPQKWY